MTQTIVGELAKYTIIGAQDWPMFKMMLSVLGTVFVVLWAVITSLIGFMWHDLRGRISIQRKEDHEKCHECHVSHTREFDNIWLKLNKCCDKIGVTE